MGRNYRIGFFLLDEIHHVNHFITVAIALSQHHQVHILTYPGDHIYLRTKLKTLGGEHVIIEELKTFPLRALTDYIKNRKHPRKGFWMKKNHRYLLSQFDALVFTDYIQRKLLKYRGENAWPKFIKLPHGVAGRGYVYKNDLLDFDCHIIFGTYYYEQLKKKQLLGNKTVVVGYPKLDALKNKETPTLFNNNRPTVFYNPHFGLPFSSWFDYGLDILEFFKNQDTYNLIFAPHINLFNKVGGETDRAFLNEFTNVSHMLIDLGSEASVDMEYIKAADIYLGDVSSQSFEFIINPRPCIFINTERIDYEDDINYRFWKAGQVIEHFDQLEAALNASDSSFTTYEPIQKQLTEGNFYQEHSSNSTATTRAAKELILFLDEQTNED